MTMIGFPLLSESSDESLFSFFFYPSHFSSNCFIFSLERERKCRRNAFVLKSNNKRWSKKKKIPIKISVKPMHFLSVAFTGALWEWSQKSMFIMHGSKELKKERQWFIINFIYSLVGSKTFWCGSGPHCAGHCKHRIKTWSVPHGIYYQC